MAQRQHHRFRPSPDDPRSTLWLTGDESGTFRTPARAGDRYYIVATLGVVGQRLRHEMGSLGGRLRDLTKHPKIGRPFHATDDLPAVRHAVFDLLAAHQDLVIDITVVDKTTLPRRLRRRPRWLFDLMWFHHLVHVLPTFSDPPHKIQLRIAQLSAHDATLFKPAYLDATAIGYTPFMDARFMEQWARDQQGPYYGVPALLFGDVDALKDRFGQAVDYAAWAAHRKWEYGDTAHYESLRHLIRSAREVSFTPVPEDKFATPIVLAGGLKIKPQVRHLRSFAVDARYVDGPTDPFQALIAFQQAADNGRESEAAARAAMFSPNLGIGDGVFALFRTMAACIPKLDSVEAATSMVASISRITQVLYPSKINDFVRDLALAEAKYTLALRFGAVANDAEAMQVYDEIIADYCNLTAVPIVAVVAKALVNLAHIHRRAGRKEVASRLYRRACEMGAMYPSPMLDDPAGRATLCLLEIEGEHGSLSPSVIQLAQALVKRLRVSRFPHAAAWLAECEARLDGRPPQLAPT